MKKMLSCICFFLYLCCTWVGAQQQQQERERVIFIPYDKLEKVTVQGEEGIYLSYQEYRKLVEELEKARESSEQKPEDVIVITQADYQAELVKNFLQVEASYQLDILEKGWHTLKLPFENIAFQKALLNDVPAFLKFQKDHYQLLVKTETTGIQELKLSFVTEVQMGKNRDANVNFGIPRAPVAKLNLRLPHEQTEADKLKIEITPSLLDKKEVQEQATVVETFIGNTNNIQIYWQSQAERKVEIKKIVNAENNTLLHIGENFLNIQSDLSYDVLQGEMTRSQIKIPEGFQVFSVRTTKGKNIEEWTFDQESNLLQVEFAEPVSDQGEGEKVDQSLEVKLERIVQELSGSFNLPALEILEVEREKGFYAITTNDLQTLKILERKDISQIDVNDLPQQMLQQNPKFAFKYLKRPFTLKAEIEKIDPEYDVVTYVRAFLDETVYELQSKFLYQIRKSRIFQSRIAIPEGFLLREIKAFDHASNNHREDQIKEYKEIEENGQQFLLITFKKGMNSEKLVIELEMRKNFAEESEVREFALPVFKVQGAKSETGHIGIGVKSSFNITTVKNSPKNITPLDVKELYKEQSLLNFSRSNLNLGFSYMRHPIAARFKMEKRQPVVSAEVFHYISIEENLRKHLFDIFYEVKYTGVKQFSFTLPSDVAKEVPPSRITDNKNIIKEINRTEQPENNNYLYTIETQREILGNYQVKVEYETELKQIEPGSQRRIDIFELVTQNTERENGFIVFKKNNNLFLEPVYNENLQPANVNDPSFAKRGQKDNVLAVYKYSTHNHQLTIILEKLQFESVYNTIINRLHISSSVNKDFTSKNEAVIAVVNNRKQFLDFTLPANSELVSVGRLNKEISGRRSDIDRHLDPITPSKREDGKGYRVNIVSNTKKDRPFVLVIEYDTKIQEHEMGYSGNFSLQPIEFGEVPVTYFTWDLGLPQDFEYMQFDTHMVRSYPDNYGIWNALLDFGPVDTTVIKQDAETGVIPIYGIKGKLFSFSHLNQQATISVDYMYENWLDMLYLVVFFATLAVIIFVPKTQIMDRLSLVMIAIVLAALLSALNLQGYQYFYIMIFWASALGALGAFSVRVGKVVSQHWAANKGHTLYREKESSSEQSSQQDSKEKE